MVDDKMRETLSALVDGELEGRDVDRAIHDLQNEPEQREAWQRYHLIGDAMRKNIPLHHDDSFASRISQAIDSEQFPGTTVVEFRPKPDARQPAVSSRSRPLAGFALAASVAAVAYLGVGMVALDDQVAAPHLAGNTPQLSSPVAQAPLDGVQTVQGQRWNVDTPAVESRLNSYLHNHNTLSSVTAMNSLMLPNVRLVETQPVQGE